MEDLEEVEAQDDESGTAPAGEYLEFVESESRYVQIVAFIRKQHRASCTEIMKEFHISYAESVRYMDELEERGIVDVANPEDKGGRPLLAEKGRKKKDEQPKSKSVPPVEPRVVIEEPVSKVLRRPARARTGRS